jgi:hypothetical protein
MPFINALSFFKDTVTDVQLHNKSYVGIWCFVSVCLRNTVAKMYLPHQEKQHLTQTGRGWAGRAAKQHLTKTS